MSDRKIVIDTDNMSPIEARELVQWIKSHGYTAKLAYDVTC